MFCLFAVAAVVAAEQQEPRPAPPLKVTLTDGKPLSLAQYRGKVVAVEFVYTTCPHCQQTAQITSKLVREYGPRGFRAIAVAFNDGAELLAPEFAKEFDITFPVGVGTKEMMFEYVGMPPQPFRLPVLVILDRKGNIRVRHTGDDPFFANTEASLRNAIEPLLREPAPDAAAPKKK